MRKKVLSVVVSFCMMLGFIWGSDTAIHANNAITFEGNTLKYIYTTSNVNIVRFDIHFYAGTSDVTRGTVDLGFVKANTGRYAAQTSQGVTISKTSTGFEVTLDMNNLGKYGGGSIETDNLKAPNTHLWMLVIPCNESSSMGQSYWVDYHLGNFDSWSSITNGDFMIGSADYDTLDAALSAANATEMIEMKANPKTNVTGILKNDVTLKDKNGKSYKANGADANIQVDTNGIVTVLATGTGSVHADGDTTVNVKASDGTIKKVYTRTGTGYDIVAGATSYISGIIANSAIDVDGVFYFSNADTNRFLLPEPMDGDGDITHAQINAGIAASLKADGKTISTSTTNTKNISINKKNGSTIVTLPSGGKVTIDGVEYSNTGTDDMKINLSFEAYRNEKTNEVDLMHQSGESNEIKTLIDNAKKAIKDYSYDDTKTLAENKAAIDALLTTLNQDVSAQESAEFASYKTAKKTELNNKLATVTSDEAKVLINDTIRKIENTAYDKTKTLAENKAVIDHAINDLNNDLAKAADFNTYKDSKKQELQRKLAAESSNEVKALINDAISKIDQTTFDKNKSLDENKEKIDRVINELDTATEFSKYKDSKKTDLEKLLDKVESNELKNSIRETMQKISDYAFDKAKSLDENKAAVDALITELNGEISTAMKPNDPNIMGQTAHSITIDAIKGLEYSIDNGAHWVGATKDGALSFENLEKATTYNVLVRTPQNDNLPASQTASKEVTTMSKSAKDIADMFKTGNEETTETGSGLNEVASNANVEVRVDENGNYIVKLINDINKTIVLPDNLGKITVDMNGHNITGETGNDGIKIVAGTGAGETTNLFLTGSGKVSGGHGLAGSNGGNGIAVANDTKVVDIHIDSNVKVYGGNGGTGSDANVNGGNGGAGITGNTNVYTQGTIYGGMGGNAIKNGTAGNGGHGIVTKHEVVVLTNGKVLGGNGGNAANGSAGNGGYAVKGHVASNQGALVGGNGGNSDKGTAGLGGNSATSIGEDTGVTIAGKGGLVAGKEEGTKDPTTSNNKKPNTGDTNSFTIWLFMMVLTGVGSIFMGSRKNRMTR